MLRHRLEEIKLCNNISDAQAAMFDREHPQYPYKSHGQWLKAMYGMVACAMIVVFNGVGPFLEDPLDIRHIVAYYIGVSFHSILSTSGRHSSRDACSHAARYQYFFC